MTKLEWGPKTIHMGLPWSPPILWAFIFLPHSSGVVSETALYTNCCGSTLPAQEYGIIIMLDSFKPIFCWLFCMFLNTVQSVFV